VSFEKLVVITRKTRLESLIERFNSVGQAKFVIEHAGGDFSDYQEEHDTYRQALDEVVKSTDLGLKLQVMDRRYVPTYLFTPDDLIMTVGQDGLVANTAKYVAGQPLVAINPDPKRFDGILLPFEVREARGAIEAVLEGTAEERRVTLAEVELNDGQRLLAFNDFFIGAKSHISARYRIQYGEVSERQSSSGVLVSTGAGSTGWLSSVFNMASGVARFRRAEELTPILLDWEALELFFVVREPFESRHSRANLVAGLIEPGTRLELESHMPSTGVIFSDGIEKDFLNFNSGAVAKVGIADQAARLIV